MFYHGELRPKHAFRNLAFFRDISSILHLIFVLLRFSLIGLFALLYDFDSDYFLWFAFDLDFRKGLVPAKHV